MKLRITAIFFFSALHGFAAQQPAAPLPSYLQGIGLDQKLGAALPLQAQFTDDSGRAVRLGDYMGSRPALLALVYYTCPALCDEILHGVVNGLRPLSLVPGRDFDVIAISINPDETPADASAKKREFVTSYFRNASPQGWHFLTGSESNIRAVADAIGFHYRYDPKTKMFFHPAGIIAVTPEGKAARYLYGIEYAPKDLKLGLIEASHGRIGSPVDQILLFCYHYDPSTGKYTATVLNLLHASAAVFLLLLVVTLGLFWRLDILGQRKASSEVQHP